MKVGAELLEQQHDKLVLADKAYISQPLIQHLAHTCQVELKTVPQRNQKLQLSPAEQHLHNHFRQIVETVNGQLVEQFHLQQNYAHSFWSLVSRLYCKLTAHTLCLVLNRRLGYPQPLQIKHLAFPISV